HSRDHQPLHPFPTRRSSDLSHNMFLEPLSRKTDNLDNKHANTQIPKFVGFARIAELDGDEKYNKAGSFSWETITAHRSLAFGGKDRKSTRLNSSHVKISYAV